MVPVSCISIDTRDEYSVVHVCRILLFICTAVKLVTGLEQGNSIMCNGLKDSVSTDTNINGD